MPLFTGAIALFSAVGSFIAGATGVGGFLLKTALSIGLSYAAQALAGKPKQQANPPFSIQGSIRAAGALARSFMCGEGMTAGSLAYANTWGPAGGTPNSHLVQVIALSDLPDKGLKEVWINGQKVTLLTGEAHTDFGWPVSEYRKDGTDHLWIKFYDGTQTAADPYLVEKFEEDELYPYEDTREGEGITYAICTARVNETLFTGFPEYKFVLEGAKLYDISKDTTAGGDGAQRWSDRSTWGGDGDNLPAVQLYNIIRGISYGGEWFYGLQGVAAAQIPNEEWIAAIEKCRAAVEGPDGNEPQYRCGGEIAVSTRIADTVEALLTSCNGRLAEIGGFYKAKVGAPDEAVAEFTDGDIISTAPQSFTPFHGLADTINGIAGKYPEPAEGWNVKSAPTRHDPDFEAQDGGRRLLADVDYSMVPYKGQVQRLMESALLEARRARRHTLTLPARFWQYEPGDVLEWTSERNGYEAKSFRIDGMTDLSNLDVLVDLTEVDATDYDWDQETDYRPPVDGPVGIARPQPQPIIDWFAEPYTLVDSSSTARRAAIKLTWDGQVDDVEAVEYEVRLSGETEIILTGRTDSVASGALIISQNILPNETYEVRGRYIPASYRDTLWSDWLEVTTPPVAEVDLSVEIYALLRRVEEMSGLMKLDRQRFANISEAVLISQALVEEYRGQLSKGIATRYKQNIAAVEVAMEAISTVSSALAQFAVGVFASTGAGTAEALMRFTALSDLAEGMLARFKVEVRASTEYDFADAGLELAVVSTPSGLRSVAILGGDQVYLKVGGVVIPAKGLQRGDEAMHLTDDGGEIVIDFGQMHRSFTCTLTQNAIIRFPLNGWINAKADLIVYNPNDKDLDVDYASIIVNSGGLPQPTAGANSYALYELTVMSMSPPRAAITLKADGSTTSADEAQFSIDPPDPVTGRSLWNLAVHGPLVLEGPPAGSSDLQFKIVPLGPRLDAIFELVGAGGTSGTIDVSTPANPATPSDTTITSTDHSGFTPLVAQAGRSSTSYRIDNGISLRPGGSGGTTSGADSSTNGQAGQDGQNVLTPPFVRGGKGGDSAEGTGPNSLVLPTSGTYVGQEGVQPGADEFGAGAAGPAYVASVGGGYYIAIGGGAGGAKAVRQFDTFDQLLQGKEYILTLAAPKTPVISSVTGVTGTNPNGKPGGRSKATISAI